MVRDFAVGSGLMGFVGFGWQTLGHRSEAGVGEGGEGVTGSLTFLFEPEAFTANVNYGAAMEQTVQGGGGHDGITAEDFGPIAEG